MQIIAAHYQDDPMLKPDQLHLLHTLAKQASAGSLTQAALADATGVHQSQISRILAGKVRHASKNVLKLCKYAKSLPSAMGPQDNNGEEILAAVAKLLGKSSAEDRALAHLVGSLTDWRKSWGGSR